MDWGKQMAEVTAPVFIATAGENLEGELLLLASELRQHSVAAETEMMQRSLKAQMKYAGKQGFQYVAIIGEDEIARGRVTLRNMESGEQIELSRAEALSQLKPEKAVLDTEPAKEPLAAVTLPPNGQPLQKSHYCGALRLNDVGSIVKLAGWVGKRRDHGGLIFIDLRDRSGIMQLVFDQQLGSELFNQVESLRSEFVVAVEGEIVKRSEETINPSLPTGEIEIWVSRMEILNSSKTPPFYIEDDLNVDENLRLRYRYLDLRRPEMLNRLKLRHRTVKLVRDYMDRFDFLEVETPMLTRSTPEGARDFLVPSRPHPGSFYALPQSPQLFKQLLMVSGIERYFQVVRCFRDEDLRADRQPEFTQIDIETSFFGSENLFALIEGMVAMLWKDVHGIELKLPFLRMPHREAMERFGSDKPDIRFAMELVALDDLAAKSSFKVFTSALSSNGAVKGLRVPGGSKMSRKDLDDLTLLARQLGAKGLAWTFNQRQNES